MNALIIFVGYLLNIIGGVIAFAFTVLFLAVLGVVAVKAFRILIALFHYSIAEPEARIVAGIQKLNISAAKKKSKVHILNGGVSRPEPWPDPPKGSPEPLPVAQKKKTKKK